MRGRGEAGVTGAGMRESNPIGAALAVPPPAARVLHALDDGVYLLSNFGKHSGGSERFVLNGESVRSAPNDGSDRLLCGSVVTGPVLGVSVATSLFGGAKLEADVSELGNVGGVIDVLVD